MLYTGGYTIEATVNPKIQTAMENLMLNTDDAYFPAGWHEEEVTASPTTMCRSSMRTALPRPAPARTVRSTITAMSAPRRRWSRWTMTAMSSHGGRSGRKDQEPFPEPRYGVTRQTGSAIKPIGVYALGIEYGLVNWSTMLNNSPLYLKQDMVIRDEDYCRRNGSWA